MTYKLIHRSLQIGNRSFIHNRKFRNFPSLNVSIKVSFCTQIKDKSSSIKNGKEEEEEDEEEENDDDEQV